MNQGEAQFSREKFPFCDALFFIFYSPIQIIRRTKETDQHCTIAWLFISSGTIVSNLVLMDFNDFFATINTLPGSIL